MPQRRTALLSASVASWLTLSLVLALTLPCWAAASAETAASKPPKLFSRDDTLEVTIMAPWRDLERKDAYQGTYPAQLKYSDDGGNTVTLDLTVARRGVKRQEACNFPPVRLRFEKDVVKGTMFRGQKSLKMVTHCKSSKSYDQYYILEMLAYRIYNLLTDYSFRVRPLQVTYIDSKTGKADDSRFAFLIEDDSDVAKRNDLKKIRVPKISPSRLDPQLTTLLSLFQFMIGNTDWAALMGPDPKECCHNIKLIGPQSPGSKDFIIAVPYDFDSSGLVDARYAAPHEALGIKSVTQRLYRGYCMHNAMLETARQEILAQESAILALIEDEQRLTSRSKKKARRYLEGFFDIARNPDKFERYVIEQCRR